MLLLDRAAERRKYFKFNGSGSQYERGAEVGWKRESFARRLKTLMRGAEQRPRAGTVSLMPGYLLVTPHFGGRADLV